MKRFRYLLSLLGSTTVTVWFAGLFIVFYITMAVWSKESFAHFVGLLSGNIVAKALYVLFLLNLLLRIVNSLRNLWPAKRVFLLRLPLYAGTFVFLLAFFLSLNLRKNEWILAGEGDTLEMPWNQKRYHVVKIVSALEKNTLRTGESGIFRFEPLITLADDTGTLHTIGAFPPRSVQSTYMHILKFGIGPGIELMERNKVLVRTYIALRLMPFGTVDTFELPDIPYSFYLSILPNRTIKKGRETGQEYNLEKPLYSVEIVKGDKVIMKKETDAGLAFDKDMALAFYPPSDWVLLDVAYDPALPLFAAGLIMACSGLILYPFSFVFRNRRT